MRLTQRTAKPEIASLRLQGVALRRLPGFAKKSAHSLNAQIPRRAGPAQPPREMMFPPCRYFRENKKRSADRFGTLSRAFCLATPMARNSLVPSSITVSMRKAALMQNGAFARSICMALSKELATPPCHSVTFGRLCKERGSVIGGSVDTL